MRWELAHDEAFTRIAQQGQAQALPDLAHSVHVEVAGLDTTAGTSTVSWSAAPATTRSARGAHTHLARARRQAASLRLAYASCQRWEHGYFSAWRHLVADRPDAVVFLGDYIYEYPGAVNAVRLAPAAGRFTLDDYRKRYALYKGDADLQAAARRLPLARGWDDHEVQNDYAGLTPATAARRSPISRPGARRRTRLSTSTCRCARACSRGRWPGWDGCGDAHLRAECVSAHLATLHLLDARQYRSPHVCTRDGRLGSSNVDPATCASWTDPARTMLGAEQERWLADSFGRSAGESGWNLLGQTTLFGPRDFKPGAGQSLWNDGWDGYAPARPRWSTSLRKQRVANPVLLGGDVHENWVGHVQADYAEPGQRERWASSFAAPASRRVRAATPGPPNGWPRTRTSSLPTPSARATASSTSRRSR